MILSESNAYKNRQNSRRTLFWQAIPILILVVIAGLAYGIFYAPILYSDDWSVVLGRWYFDNLEWFDLTEIRPLLKTRLIILYNIFGLNVHAFYGVLWTLNVLNAIVLYFLVLRFFPKKVIIAFSVAAIALVYPADLTHMWLIMINIRTVVLLTLLYAYLLLYYVDTGEGWSLWLALLCLVISLGMYEGQFGIVMTWCLLMIWRKKPKSWRSVSMLLLPLGIGILFVVWRLFGYPLLGMSDYNYSKHLQPVPALIVGRLIRGFQVMLWAWLDPVTHSYGLAGWQAVLILSLLVLLGVFLAYVVSQTFRNLAGRHFTVEQHSDQLRRFMIMMFVGPLLIIAGYLPSVVFLRPTLFQLYSRLNILPLLGAAIALVALLTVIILLLSHAELQINSMILAGVMPLIIMGVMVQARVQYDDRTAWEVQKQVWHQLFRLIPDLRNGARVIFVLTEIEEQEPSLNRNGQRLPFAGGWDISTGLNMLYGKYDLSGDLATEESFLREGIKGYYGDEITPYNQVVVLVYDVASGRLRIVQDLGAENLVDFPVPDYAPYEHIIRVPTTRVGYRWLVGLETD